MRLLDILNPFGAPVYHEETVASTMDVSRELAGRGLPHGTVIAAYFQTAGRGRGLDKPGTGGRRPWEMEGGNLAFTVLLRFRDTCSIPCALTLRAGLAVSLAIEDFLPELSGLTRVKWPNDIMVNAVSKISAAEKNARAKKTAGILTEADGGNVYVGIGINVTRTEFPEHLRDKAASLSIAAGRNILSEERFDLLEKILSRMFAELEKKTEAESWNSRLEERLYKKGERVTFVEGRADSGRMISGRLIGIGSDGGLLITPDGEDEPRAFFSGELGFL